MNRDATYTIRALEPTHEAILSELLYQAIFVPAGSAPPSRDILHSPELSKYVRGFGKSSDLGYLAFSETNQPMGAAWLRLLTVMSEYRGRGIGTLLLERLFEKAQANYQSVSLSVWRENPAYRLYQRLGFETVKQNENDVVMLKRL